MTLLAPSRWYLPQLFPVAFCLGDLSWLFAVAICRSYLPWAFFVYVSKRFFWLSKSFFFLNKPSLNESKPFFIYVQNAKLLFKRISLLTVFLSAIVLTVMGHRIKKILRRNYWSLFSSFKTSLLCSSPDIQSWFLRIEIFIWRDVFFNSLHKY